MKLYNTQPIFVVRANKDRTEGRGGMEDVCIVPNKQVGQAIVKSQAYAHTYGVMGTPGSDFDVYEYKPPQLPVVESVQEFAELVRHQATLNALKKLTPEEQKILGLAKL